MLLLQPLDGDGGRQDTVPRKREGEGGAGPDSHTLRLQSATPFNLRQPFNLLAFLQQEERVSVLRNLRRELLQYKLQFEGMVDRESFQRVYQSDHPDCWLTKSLDKFDLHFSTVIHLEDKGIRYMHTHVCKYCVSTINCGVGAHGRLLVHM